MKINIELVLFVLAYALPVAVELLGRAIRWNVTARMLLFVIDFYAFAGLILSVGMVDTEIFARTCDILLIIPVLIRTMWLGASMDTRA